MLRALDRWAAWLLLGAGGVLAAVSALFSAGSSGGRLTWIGIAALVISALIVAGALVGLPRPELSREALVALGFLLAFVAWNGISVLWSIEADRSWAYLNRGLVYVALAVIGLWFGPWLRQWAYVLAGVLALPLGWALLGKAIPALGGSGRIARLSSPIGYWNALGLLFAMALPLAIWLAARRDHRHWLRTAGVVYIYALVVGLLLTYSRGGVLAASVAIALWLVFGRPRVESAAALLLGGGAGLELVLDIAACVITAVGSTPFTDTVRNVTAALLAIGMGIQNAVARRLAVPDLTTTVLTMTLTGLAADVRSGTNLTVRLRRLTAVAAMLGGGVLGAELVLHTSAAVTLGIAAGLILIVAGGAGLAMRRPGAWRKPTT